mgnify:CR=1 FL=1
MAPGLPLRSSEFGGPRDFPGSNQLVSGLPAELLYMMGNAREIQEFGMDECVHDPAGHFDRHERGAHAEHVSAVDFAGRLGSLNAFAIESAYAAEFCDAGTSAGPEVAEDHAELGVAVVQCVGNRLANGRLFDEASGVETSHIEHIMALLVQMV